MIQAAACAITDVVRVSTGEDEGAPGLILALQTFGQDLTFHPHIHVLATEGLVRPDDTFVPVATIDALLLEHTLRRTRPGLFPLPRPPSAALTPTACSSHRIFHPTCDPSGLRPQPVRPAVMHPASLSY